VTVVRANLAATVLLVVGLGGCLMPRYLAQAAHGQAHLLGARRPISEVVEDPDVPLRTRMLLAEVPAIKAYGAAYGLDTRANYDTYVELDGRASVWFVGAADPLSFRTRRWCFPIAGCFTGLGWFDEDDAVAHRDELRAQGYDAFARPAGAYSTGGWFPDPVVSSMLADGDGGYPELANVVLHESVHATVFVPDQPFFNESFAEYVADRLTDAWVIERFGAGSPEQLAWQLAQTTRQARVVRQVAAYRALKALYDSDAPDADKLAKKAVIIDALVDELRLVQRPNNASLIELRVYHEGGEAHARAHRACGDLRTLIETAHGLGRGDFPARLSEDLSPIADELVKRCAGA
jgi:predicted aminopeptidase